ncbi:hypothetical protein Tco_0631028, partial [Tanacetum coccineum]
VAFLEKAAESDGFYEIIDFLNANQIHYALTANPTIYTSCIEQFWATTKAKTINGERQLQALVDKKKVIITETSIRSDIHLEDAGGIDCLLTATIFEELARMGAKTTTWNEFSSTMASAIICLAINQKFNLSKYIFDAMKKQFRRKHEKTTAVPHPSDSTANVPNEESVPTHFNDPLLSGEDRLKLTDLMDMCTKLSERVLDLEHTKTAQAQEIKNLKLREDASNQGRSIQDIDKDAEVSLVNETHGRSDDAEMFDTDALIGNEVFVENDMIEKDQDVIPKEVSTAANQEPLSEDILGATTQRDTRNYYPKSYWEILPKEILGDTTQRDIGRYYPKRYWESLPEDILGVTTLRDTSMYLGNNISG